MFNSVNPAIGEVIAAYRKLTPDDVDARLDPAAVADRTWSTVDGAEPAALLDRIADPYARNEHRLARTAATEMGRTLAAPLAEAEKRVAVFHYNATKDSAMVRAQRILPSGGGSPGEPC